MSRNWKPGLALRMLKSPRIQGGTVRHVTAPHDWLTVKQLVEKMAAEREPHWSRSVDTAAFSVQEGIEEQGEFGPCLLSGQRQGRCGRRRVWTVRRGRLPLCTNSEVETGLDFQKQGAAPATNLFCAPSLSPVPGHRRGSARFSAALWQGFALLSMGRNWFPPARWWVVVPSVRRRRLVPRPLACRWASPRPPFPPRGPGHGSYLSARCRQRCPPGTASGSPNPLANLPFQGTSLGVPSRSLHNPASNPL